MAVMMTFVWPEIQLYEANEQKYPTKGLLRLLYDIAFEQAKFWFHFFGHRQNFMVTFTNRSTVSSENWRENTENYTANNF